MKRVIYSLSKDAYSCIKNDIPRAIKSESIYEKTEVIDVELSDNVIMKVYDEEIVLDLGAKKVVLESYEFKCISIV